MAKFNSETNLAHPNHLQLSLFMPLPLPVPLSAPAFGREINCSIQYSLLSMNGHISQALSSCTYILVMLQDSKVIIMHRCDYDNYLEGTKLIVWGVNFIRKIEFHGKKKI